jgi:hypothetical protein
MAPWLEAGEPITGVNTMARVDNRYRRLVDDDGLLVTGLLLWAMRQCARTRPPEGASFAYAQQLVSIETMESLIRVGLEFDA